MLKIFRKTLLLLLWWLFTYIAPPESSLVDDFLRSAEFSQIISRESAGRYDVLGYNCDAYGNVLTIDYGKYQINTIWWQSWNVDMQPYLNCYNPTTNRYECFTMPPFKQDQYVRRFIVENIELIKRKGLEPTIQRIALVWRGIAYVY